MVLKADIYLLSTCFVTKVIQGEAGKLLCMQILQVRAGMFAFPRSEPYNSCLNVL